MTVRTEGLERTIRGIKAIGDREVRRDVAYVYANALQKDTAEYPPQSSANRPGNGYAWYVRGFGVRTRTGKAYRTSEDMINRWKVRRTSDGAEATNDASYSGYAHDEQRQVWFHRLRGWRTYQRVARVNRGKYDRMAADETDRLMAERFRG